MFQNVFEELLFLRFISKNAQHQREMNQKMLKAQKESLQIQKGNVASTQSGDAPRKQIKTRAERKAQKQELERFDLGETIKEMNPLDRNVSSSSKPKHVWLSVLLTLTLGPIGLLYSTKKYAVIMTIIFIIAAATKVDSFMVWLIINTTIVAIGAYKTIEWNDSLYINEVNKE